MYVILGSELELKKVQTAVSKHLGFLPKIGGGGGGGEGAIVLRFGSKQPL